MKTCFLFGTAPSPEDALKKRFWYWAWQLFWVAASGLGIGAATMLLCTGPYSLGLLRTFIDRPFLIFLNVAIPVGTALVFYGLIRRASTAFVVNAVLFLSFSFANYYKMSFRDDPLVFADLFLAKEAGNMMKKYRLFLNRKLIFVLACAILGWLFLRFLVRGRPARFGRLAGTAALLGMTLVVLMVHTDLDHTLYNGKAAYYQRLNNRWSATQQYIGHGFIYPFINSVNESFETPPEGYQSDVAAQISLSFPGDVPIPEGQKVNIVGIMLEAFQDISRFGEPELAFDVYEPFHALEAESYSGELVTNIFAGGTVDTERCFLTGYSKLPTFRTNTNAYPWYFRSQGYQVVGLHPCFQWFYDRQNVNYYLGFQNYKFVENFFGEFTGGKVATDDIFFDQLKKDLLARQPGAPIFSFSVTYQGHGPYDTDVTWWGEPDMYTSPDCSYTTEERYLLANYFGSIYNTMQHLTAFKEFLAEQEEPYILVVFGDHNPYLGEGNTLYKKMGVNLDQSTAEGFLNYYSTRYFIWANEPAKQVLGNDFVGEGPTIGPYFLMNELFKLCGWEGPSYLQSLTEVAEKVPVQHTKNRYMENGELTRTLSPEGAEISKNYLWLQYYERQHFRYKDLVED